MCPPKSCCNVERRRTFRALRGEDAGIPSATDSKKSAFSVVELLVVVGIIAIILAILLPAMNKARESAKTVRCSAQLRQIGQAIISYATANRGLMPPHSDGHSYPNDINPHDP